ncbi:unnamed protein product [Brassica oleracea]
MQKRLFLWFSEIGREVTQGFRLVNGSACGLSSFRVLRQIIRSWMIVRLGRFASSSVWRDTSSNVVGAKISTRLLVVGRSSGVWKHWLQIVAMKIAIHPQDAMHVFSFTLGLSGLRISTIVVVMQLSSIFTPIFWYQLL